MSNLAALVVTVSFHECVFALKQGNPVLAVDAAENRFHHKNGQSKIKCLMDEFELTASNYLNCLRGNFDKKTFIDKVMQSSNLKYKRHVDKSNLLGLKYIDALDKVANIME